MLYFEQTTDVMSSIYEDSLFIRRNVFINEQNVAPSIEIDEKEKLCFHIVAYDENGHPIATARLYPIDQENIKIQRVAVLKSERGKNIGKLLMEEVERNARHIGAKRVFLGAQYHALPFYQKLGYTIFGTEYEEAGILHQDVEKKIQ